MKASPKTPFPAKVSHPDPDPVTGITRRTGPFGLQQREGERGFTLIELLIVIVVLGVLAATVIFALSGVTNQSAVAACTSDATTIENAVVAYNAQTGGATPPTMSSLISGSYINAAPTNPQYAITIVNGVVMIAAPASATAVAYGTGGACSTAGVTPTSSTTSTTGATPTSTTTTTTSPPATTTTTTTAPVANGVTGTASTNTYNGYGGQDILTLANTKSITSMTVTINVAQTTGVTENSGYTSLPGGAGTYGWTGNSGGNFIYTYVLNSGQTIPAGYSNGQVAAQYSGTGSPRVTTGDTWSVVSTSGGVTTWISGHF